MNSQEISTLEEQTKTLEDTIEEVKAAEAAKLQKERKVIDEINKKYKDLEKKHKNMAEQYFECRRKHKEKLK